MSLRLLCALLCCWPLAGLASDGAPFLWQVRQGETTHYLMGSMHMLPAEALPLPDALEAAYDATEGVVFETDLDTLEHPQTQAQLLAAAQAPQGIRPLIGPALHQKLATHLAALELPPDTGCAPYKPWFCAMTLEALSFTRAGFDAARGVDPLFHARARADDKPISWLEEPEDHLALFTRMPDTLAVEFLRSTLDEFADKKQDPQALLAMWRSNDVAALEQLTLDLKRRRPRVYAHLLSQRTRAWIPRLRPVLDGAAPQLIIVGAAHLVGPDGLPTLLKRAGYAVEPVSAEPAR